MKKTAFGGNRNECLLPKKKLNKHDRSAAIFCGCILGILVAHWLIFYLYANLNSILLAFQRYNPGSHEYEFLKGANVFDNFVWIFTEMFKGRNIGSYVLNGFLYQFTSVVIAFPIGIMFAFLIYKKAPFTGVYKVILFLPSMVSAMSVMAASGISKAHLPKYVFAFMPSPLWAAPPEPPALSDDAPPEPPEGSPAQPAMPAAATPAPAKAAPNRKLRRVNPASPTLRIPLPDSCMLSSIPPPHGGPSTRLGGRAPRRPSGLRFQRRRPRLRRGGHTPPS